MGTFLIILGCGVGFVVLMILIGLPGATEEQQTPDSGADAIFRGTHEKQGQTAEIHVFLDPPFAELKLFIDGKQVDKTNGEADAKYKDKAYMSIGGGFGFAQEVSVNFPYDNEISLGKGTAGRNWKRVK